MPDALSTLRKTLTLILAGGQGERLYPLTKDRAKPAVSFGGSYRIIDFTLSNCLNSGLRRIYVLTQYRSLTLDQHIRRGWDIFRHDLGEFIYTVPPQQYYSARWYVGTADAVFQNIYLIQQERPERVLLLSGDHLYKMDYAGLIDSHIERGAAVTIATVETSVSEASRFGVVETDPSGRVRGFLEKPRDPEVLARLGERIQVNMGVYVFNTDALVRSVIDDAKQKSDHDFGKNVLPALVASGEPVHAYSFVDENKKEAKYWRDIGTIASYFEASMDLVSVNPLFNLYDDVWPIRTCPRQYPPAKTVFQSAQEGRVGACYDSVISLGSIISGGTVIRSILSYDVRVNSYSHVIDSILMDHVSIGRYSRIRNTIIDEGVEIPANSVIGYDADDDAKRFVVNEGVVVVPSGIRFS
ncbi:MAG: glucose-1-phosphate adenylyltransferase [Acidobacteriota bacterium]